MCHSNFGDDASTDKHRYTVFAFNIGFYALPFGEIHGYNISFPVLGMINGIMLIPIIWLWFFGEKIRERQGLPKIHTDL